MTEITVTVKGNHYRVSLNGHALFNPGNDIVCAGISALTCTLIAELENLSDRGDIRNFVADVNDGFCVIDFEAVKDSGHVAMEMAEVGFMGIADAYPDNVVYGCNSDCKYAIESTESLA